MLEPRHHRALRFCPSLEKGVAKNRTNIDRWMDVCFVPLSGIKSHQAVKSTANATSELKRGKRNAPSYIPPSRSARKNSYNLVLKPLRVRARARAGCSAIGLRSARKGATINFRTTLRNPRYVRCRARNRRNIREIGRIQDPLCIKCKFINTSPLRWERVRPILYSVKEYSKCLKPPRRRRR